MALQASPSIFNTVSTFYGKNRIAFWLGIIILQQAIWLLTMNGTGDDGDSVNHYIHNKYAFEHPYLLINSWARPFYTLVAAPFAQFGFLGMKLFNSLMAISAAYLAYRVALKMKIPNAELAMPLLMGMPHYLILSLSGLTEPMFSCMAIGALLLLANKQHFWAALCLSFLPFVRPEGLFFLFLAAAYFAFRKEWLKFIPVLLFGHLFYTLFGVLFFEQDWNWVFAQNPNAALAPTYGETGDWTHYIKGLLAVAGVPIYVFFWAGCLAIGIPLMRQICSLRQHLIPVFLLAGTFSVIGAHTIFWKFGLFKSFGLTRNLLTIAPYVAVLSLAGIQAFWSLLKLNQRRRSIANTVVMLAVLFFLYIGSTYAIKVPRDFQLNTPQRLANEVASFLEQQQQPDYHYTSYYYPPMSMVLERNPFDPANHRILTKANLQTPFPENSIVIWDDWYAAIEGKVSLEMLEKQPELQHLKSFEAVDKNGRKRILAVFKSRDK